MEMELFVSGPSETPHQTKEAREKQHDLWCHKCDSMFDGDKCLNLTHNSSSLHHKCSKEQRKCLVILFFFIKTAGNRISNQKQHSRICNNEKNESMDIC